MCEYQGEIDEDGNATGYGEAFNKMNKRMKYSGTWYNNLMHGICKVPQKSYIGCVQVIIRMAFLKRNGDMEMSSAYEHEK